VAARERNMMRAYAESYPSSSATTVAEQAMRTARRRRVAFYIRAGLGVGTAALLALFVVTRRLVPQPGAAVSERFALQCLSPDQAAAFLRGELASSENERISIRARPPVAVIDVQGSAHDLVKVRRLLDQVDSPRAARCAAEVIVPRTTKATKAVQVWVPSGESRVEFVVPAPAKAGQPVPKVER
jgi:hypothetical protein